MKGRFIELQGGKGGQKHNFDRHKLVEGYTQDGKFVPAGGVILHNGTLAGYVQAGGNYEKPTWRIIGTINKKDRNYKYIPKYQSCKRLRGGGEPKKQDHNDLLKQTQINKSQTKRRRAGGGFDKSDNDTKSRPVSLKSAVKILREYYRHDFN
jgi:hypothetical protein